MTGAPGLSAPAGGAAGRAAIRATRGEDARIRRHLAPQPQPQPQEETAP